MKIKDISFSLRQVLVWALIVFVVALVLPEVLKFLVWIWPLVKTILVALVIYGIICCIIGALDYLLGDRGIAREHQTTKEKKDEN